MSVKRRDSKNRILRDGESQRKDGRYAYVYTDENGNQKFLYSWKLEETDRLPAGRRNCESLRSKVKRLKKDLDSGIDPNGGKITVLELTEKYIALKQGVKPITKENYRYTLSILQKSSFGNRRIDRVKLSDAKGWLLQLRADGKSYGTIQVIRGVVRPAFQMAVDDDIIRKNPFDFSTSAVTINDTVPKEALTEEQEKDFLEFIKNDNHYRKYYDAVYILFNTGLRISELSGLTVSDIDFENGIIHVDHQLIRAERKYMIGSTKSLSGVRKVPMTEGVIESFKRIIETRKDCENAPCIGDLSEFLFLRKDGFPIYASGWGARFKGMRNKYNATHDEQLKVTPHICRHTFCSKMAKKGMNPKTLQYLMGHSDISMTLNTYTHVQYEDVKKEMERMRRC